MAELLIESLRDVTQGVLEVPRIIDAKIEILEVHFRVEYSHGLITSDGVEDFLSKFSLYSRMFRWEVESLVAVVSYPPKTMRTEFAMTSPRIAGWFYFCQSLMRSEPCRPCSQLENVAIRLEWNGPFREKSATPEA